MVRSTGVYWERQYSAQLRRGVTDSSGEGIQGCRCRSGYAKRREIKSIAIIYLFLYVFVCRCNGVDISVPHVFSPVVNVN